MDEPATCLHEWVPNGILWVVDDGTRALVHFSRCLRCGEEREKVANGACSCVGSDEPGFPYCECGLPLAEEERRRLAAMPDDAPLVPFRCRVCGKEWGLTEPRLAKDVICQDCGPAYFADDFLVERPFRR